MNYLNQLINKMGNTPRSQFWLFVATLFAMTCLMFLIFHPLMGGYDIYFHFIRFDAVTTAIIEGNYPFYLDHNAIDGYGYFTKAFYPDLTMAPFAALAIVIGSQPAYLVMLFTMTILCGIFTYKAMNAIFKNNFVAILCALLYTFSFYRLIDLFPRAALGESLAFTFIPLIVWGLYEIICGDYKKWYILAIGYSLLIYTHIISSFIMLITIILLLILGYKLLKKDPIRIGYFLLATAVTTLITSFYILPMIEQFMSNTFYHQSSEKRLAQLHGGESPRNVLFSYFLGILYSGAKSGTGMLLTFFVCIRLFVYGKNASLKKADIAVLIGILFTIIMSNLYPWHTFPFNLMKAVQIPWRFCLIISFLFSVAGAVYASHLVLTKKRKILILLVVIGFTTISMGSLNKSNEGFGPYDPTYPAVMGNAYNQIGMEYLPTSIRHSPYVYVFLRGNDSIKSENNSTIIKDLKRNKEVLSLHIETAAADKLELPLVYYKGYEAVENGNKLIVNQSPNGLVEVAVKESGELKVFYGKTWVQVTSFWISITSLIGLCAYIFNQNRKKKNALH